MFNKEKQRIVTHEYYDNPNAKTARPKSMHSIRGSMRMQNSARSNQGSDNEAEPRRRSSKHSSRSKHEEEDYSGNDVKDVAQEDYQSVPQDQYPQDQYPQEMGADMQQNGQYMQPQMMMENQQYNQQQYMQDQQYAQQQPAQSGYPNQGYAGQGYPQGYWKLRKQIHRRYVITCFLYIVCNLFFPLSPFFFSICTTEVFAKSPQVRYL